MYIVGTSKIPCGVLTLLRKYSVTVVSVPSIQSGCLLVYQVAEPMQLEFMKLKETRENPSEEMQSKLLLETNGCVVIKYF